MKCFNHPDRSAIGICKSCYKGLCQECAVDLEHGLACKDKHETDVENIKMVTDKNIKIYTTALRSYLIRSLFFLFMGVLFVFTGWAARLGFSSIIGCGFVVFALVTYFRAKALFKETKI